MYKTIIVPLKCNKKDFEYMKQLNKISADVWNYCVELDNQYRENTGKQIGLSELEKQTKGKFPLHAKGIHHSIFKYCYARSAMWESRKARHKESRKVNLPYKTKKYLPTGWDYQSIRANVQKRVIFLARKKNDQGRGLPVKCHVKVIPQNIVEIELVFKDKYYLVIKYKEENNTNLIQSNNIASIDLGEIHAITSIDNKGNCVIITNRKIRSITRLKDKIQGKLKSLRSKTIKNSRKYKKYTKAIFKAKFDFDRRLNDAIHKITKLYLDWCLRNNIKTVYYGNMDGTTRNRRGKNSKFINHKLKLWRFGQIAKQLQNKLSRYGIELICVDEYYTSQKCPVCGELNKPKGRNYKCQCGYEQHRDIVGAINILNDNASQKVSRYVFREYLQIA